VPLCGETYGAPRAAEQPGTKMLVQLADACRHVGLDEAARKRGIVRPSSPTGSSANNRPRFFRRQLYKGRARIEQAIGKLKRFKRNALRCEKTAQNYGALVAFACGPHPDQSRPHGLEVL
jgi:transposase